MDVAAVTVRQLGVQVSGHGSETGRRALLWSVKLCIRLISDLAHGDIACMGTKSAESRVA